MSYIVVDHTVPKVLHAVRERDLRQSRTVPEGVFSYARHRSIDIEARQPGAVVESLIGDLRHRLR